MWCEAKDRSEEEKGYVKRNAEEKWKGCACHFGTRRV